MEVDTLLGAITDFEKKGKKETCTILDQFLCHIAKTGETMIQWSQFKSYFLFKLEKVMDDFKASSPEYRGPANPNIEYIPFEEMKERILKIVDGYSGSPFTIQRLCELLTDPKRNYTGTDKFLRGVEKNVMVVSCVYPGSEHNGSSCVSRMNGVMFPGNALPDRNVNGPGTPRPVYRTKLSLISSVAGNGLPDSTESTDQVFEQTERTISDSVASEAVGSSSGATKSKHREDDETEEENEARHDAKRLKFDEDDEENQKDETEKEVNEEESPCSAPAESSSDEEPSLHSSTELENTSAPVSEDQEPSSTQEESEEDRETKSETEDSPPPSSAQECVDTADLSDTQAQPASEPPAEPEEAENSDPVSSSSDCSADVSSYTEPSAEGSSTAENTSQSSETAGDAME
ncbi:serine/threonine-protein phosphatase 4 regulatory subunit 2-A [Trichomycterus rosablanca]|uniref:serine/threonine-protein phosphatase 4 regulatory subunit 2-A n=1 Tax=Trichomycterus rosablanca TaxID=2290929 RepID=UPI002F350388